MVDLHCHTNQSDGTCSPAELLRKAQETGIRALAITDHDTFAGYDLARPLTSADIELICGVEVSAKLGLQSVHVLGYFMTADAPARLRQWLLKLKASRRARNHRLAWRLADLGLDVTLEEAETLGRGMTGRPHFAQILVEKGYVATVQQAFDDYLGESAKAYVDRDEPQLVEVVARIRDAGGIASLAHPVRIKGGIDTILPDLRAHGLNAIEAYHSDHTAAQTNAFIDLARIHGLLVTGGSDYHGATKPGLELGTGRGGNLKIPPDLLNLLRIAGRA